MLLAISLASDLPEVHSFVREVGQASNSVYKRLEHWVTRFINRDASSAVVPDDASDTAALPDYTQRTRCGFCRLSPAKVHISIYYPYHYFTNDCCCLY